MASQATVNTIITEMQAGYAAPRGQNAEEVLGFLTKELLKLHDQDLAQAWEAMKASRKGAFWPRLPEFVEAVEAQRDRRLYQERLDERGRGEPNSPSLTETQREDRAWEMLQGTSIAGQASRGGWAMELVEFVTKEQRLPDDLEAAELCRTAERSMANWREHRRNLETEGAGELTLALLRMVDAAESRRQSFAGKLKGAEKAA